MGAANFRKSIKILINFKHFGFYEERKHGKGKKKMSMESGSGKLEKASEKSGNSMFRI